MSRLGGKCVLELEQGAISKPKHNVRAHDLNIESPLDYSFPERNFQGNFDMFKTFVNRFIDETLPQVMT
jgi:hypothetical protein